ncbi:MAG: F0F1 ATP synthase subunit B [Bacteroidales bacterium]|nr:F0F1 ATP synthase subunit B [Bacteroidales bacterium]
MSLITPDTGLLFWMVVIFGIVFFLLARFGFPIITGMVEKRKQKIEDSLRDAREIEARMQSWTQERGKMVEDARAEQADILREAAAAKATIIADAKESARDEADKLLAKARTEIAAEKESAILEIRREVALMSVEVAEKVLREKLSDKEQDAAYLDKLLREADKLPYQAKS